MRGSTMRESVTDVRIILECLQEAYQMEGDMVRSGKNIHATMIIHLSVCCRKSVGI